jgi:ankyrin repeat protein
MVQFLILNGADVHAVDSDGYTPLDLAKQKNMKNTVSLLKYSQGYTSQSEVRICSSRVVWFGLLVRC